MLLDIQPILENDLVLVRPLAGDDFAALFHVASDPLIWAQHPSSDRYKEDVFRAFFNDAMDSKGAFAIIDKKTNRVIGSTRYKRVNGTDAAVEIGWTFLARSHWGGYYNHAVKHLMLGHAFGAIDHVVFHIGQNNIRSQKAVEKIGGMKISGPEFSHLLSDRPDSVTYVIHKKDWESGRIRVE